MILFNRLSLSTLVFTLLSCSCSYTLFVSCCAAGNEELKASQRPYIINRKKYYPIPSAKGFRQKGIASWYGSGFHGRKTSNGEIYNMHTNTAAHKTLPMDTMILVKNLENNRELVVRINDRGPFVYGRIIDLSYSAAKKLGILKKGTARVLITALEESGRKGNPALPARDFTHGEYYVQIGSFAKQNNAIKLQKRFTCSGHTTVIQKYYTPKTTYYRVQVYVGNELHAARKAEKTLRKYGYTNAFLIAR